MRVTFELDRDRIVYRALNVVDKGPPVLLTECLYYSKENAVRVAERSCRITNAREVALGRPPLAIEKFLLGTLKLEIADG